MWLNDCQQIEDIDAERESVLQETSSPPGAEGPFFILLPRTLLRATLLFTQLIINPVQLSYILEYKRSCLETIKESEKKKTWRSSVLRS